MKACLVSLLILFQLPFCFGQENNPDTTLLIVGTFNLKNNLVQNIHVNLYLDNKQIDSSKVDGNQAFGFYLKRNLIYTIEFVKDGFIKKIVGVSTKLPDDVKEKPYFKFSFQVPLDKSSREHKYVKYATDFPTAVIFYNDAIGQFDYGIDNVRIKKGKKMASQ